MLIIMLSLILSFGARMIFKDNKRTANIIAVIISIISVVALPTVFLERLFGTAMGGGSVIGAILGLLIAVGLVLLLFIPLIKWKAKGVLRIIKVIFLLAIIMLISWIKVTLVSDTENIAGFIGGASLSIVFTLLMAVAAIMVFVEVFGMNVATYAIITCLLAALFSGNCGLYRRKKLMD